MGFLDKIKKALEEAQEAQASRSKTSTGNQLDINITIEQISDKLNAEIKENLEKSEKIRKEIENRVNEFKNEIDSSIEILEKIDLSKKKEHERIKTITLENLHLYMSQLNRLIVSLEKIGNQKPQDYLIKLFSAINGFNKSSRMAFEKATILIGKELAETKLKIKRFADDINNIVKNNRFFFEKEKSINNLSKLFKEFKENKNYLLELNNSIKNMNIEINDLKEECVNLNKKISNIKESEKYKKDMAEKQKIEKKAEDLNKNLLSIKEKMNLKNLARQYHSDKDKLQLIQSYSSNFKSSLDSDKELEILELITDDEIKDSLKGLIKEIEDLNKNKTTKSEQEITSLEENLKKIQEKTSLSENSLIDEEKKKEKLEIKNKDIEKEIKSLASSL